LSGDNDVFSGNEDKVVDKEYEINVCTFAIEN